MLDAVDSKTDVVAEFEKILVLSLIKDAYYKPQGNSALFVKQDMGAFSVVQIIEVNEKYLQNISTLGNDKIEESKISAYRGQSLVFLMQITENYSEINPEYKKAMIDKQREFDENGILTELLVVDLATSKLFSVLNRKIVDKKLKIAVENSIEALKGSPEEIEQKIKDTAKHIHILQSEIKKPQRINMTSPIAILIFVNVVIFIIGNFLQITGGTDPFIQIGIQDNTFIRNGEIWRLITSMFLHADFAHITGNMIFLYILGQILIPYYNKKNLLVIYFIAGLTGNLLSFLFTDYQSLGASGAIMGLGGVLVYKMIASHDRRMFARTGNYLTIIIMIVYNLMYGLLPTGANIDNYGHFGGFIGGFAVAFVIDFVQKRKKGDLYK